MSAKLNFAGVDYARFTFADHRRYEEVGDLLIPYRLETHRAGAKEKPQWMLGYYGVCTEHTFLGKRDDGMMVQVSGSLADTLWKSLSLPGARCTRLDIQVTCPASPNPNEALQRVYDQLQSVKNSRGRPAEPQIIQRPSGARMVTIGSRCSELYGRVYDKFLESKEEEYRGMLRFEVEIKGKQAANCHSWLLARPYSRQISSGLCYDFWNRRGVKVEWEREGPVAAPPPLVLHKTNESRVAWIAAQVAPTIAKLCCDGYATEVAGALLSAIREDANYGIRTRQLSRMLEIVFQGGSDKL